MDTFIVIGMATLFFAGTALYFSRHIFVWPRKIPIGATLITFRDEGAFVAAHSSTRAWTLARLFGERIEIWGGKATETISIDLEIEDCSVSLEILATITSPTGAAPLQFIIDHKFMWKVDALNLAFPRLMAQRVLEKYPLNRLGPGGVESFLRELRDKASQDVLLQHGILIGKVEVNFSSLSLGAFTIDEDDHSTAEDQSEREIGAVVEASD